MKTNEELQKDVMEEIKWDPQLSSMATQIGVTAKDGVVTLSGNVDTFTQKLAVEKAAQRVSGVKVVAVDIEVAIKGIHERTDTEIAEAVKNALTWHSAVNEGLIDIKVDNGWIYLDGTAEWDYQKKAAETVVRDLIGVRGVTNRIAVRSQTAEPREIKRKIAAAFHRSASMDSKNVEVEVYQNKVTLTGKVRTWAERTDAERVAWSIPGVTIVENKIEVDVQLSPVVA